jgi:hypothetical protein
MGSHATHIAIDTQARTYASSLSTVLHLPLFSLFWWRRLRFFLQSDNAIYLSTHYRYSQETSGVPPPLEPFFLHTAHFSSKFMTSSSNSLWDVIVLHFVSGGGIAFLKCA